MKLAALAMWTPGIWELAIVGTVALLIFGRRLPDVARSVGRSIVEFKRGLKDVKDEIDVQSQTEARLEVKPEGEQPPADKPAAPVESTGKSSATSK